MKWLSNTYDPAGPWPEHHVVSVEQWRLWLSDKIVGDPKPTEKYSVEELKAMRVVGVYSR